MKFKLKDYCYMDTYEVGEDYLLEVTETFEWEQYHLDAAFDKKYDFREGEAGLRYCSEYAQAEVSLKNYRAEMWQYMHRYMPAYCGVAAKRRAEKGELQINWTFRHCWETYAAGRAQMVLIEKWGNEECCQLTAAILSEESESGGTTIYEKRCCADTCMAKAEEDMWEAIKECIEAGKAQ